MKQKRKVKSLLPQKNDWRSSFLTAVLLILSVALCIGSASLITSRVWAEEIHGLQYTGLDDKQEVLYGMRFVDRNDMETPVNKMYMKNNSLYITPNPVVVNPMTVGGSETIDTNINMVKPGVYGHVLGGYKNKVKSDNVTLIAGENNVVTEGNDNAAFLGGQSNNNFGRMREGGTPMVVVGGSNNSIGDDHDGVALIGGNGNKIGDNVSDSFILGGEDNEIESGLTNVIVGGKKVKVRTVNNVFVYSNKGDGISYYDEFEPLNSNSFYLNVDGVGINTNPSARGLAVGGVVNLGQIEIPSISCDQDHNLGVEGSYFGCVVGCTKAGAAVGKWEMLDRGARCQGVCGDAYDYCIYTGEVIEPAPSYDAFCTSSKTNKDIFTGHSHMCYTGELGEYQNVVYETSLIDSDKQCPEKNENKCVYQCDQGYHLTGNFAGNDKDTVRCYQDCLYEWADEGVKRYKHNETVIGYNSGQVHCARQPDVDKGTKNDPYPEHCGNNQHKKMLVCNNGTMYIADSDKKATNDKAADKGYRFFNCGTVDFRCNIAVYDLSAEIITKSFVNGGLQDTNMVWNTTDRSSSSKGDRGIYKLCLDYNSNSTNNETCDLVHTGNPREEHYKFVRCQDGYDEYPTGSKKCMQKCTVKTDDGATVTINHAAIYEFYLKSSETCTGVCIGQNFECNDGTFYSTGADHKKRQDSNYKYSKCMLNKFRCDKAEYNVTYYQWNDLNWKAKGHYSSCDDYDPDPSNGKNAKACKKVETNYKLDYCYEGYHTEDMRECIDNVTLEPCTNQPSSAFDTTWHWVRLSGPIQTYPWSNIIPEYKALVSEGMYFKRWSDSCSWNDPASLCWVHEYPDGNNDGKVVPGDACEWRCNVGYRDSGNYCQKIDTTCQYPDNNQNACVNTEPYACKDSQHTDIENQRLDSDGITWKWDCVNGIEADRKHCMLCKDGYHIESGKCVANVDGQCNNNTKYGCYKGYKAERTEFDNKYTWDCLGIPSNDSSSTRKPGPNCTAADDDIGCYICKKGYEGVNCNIIKKYLYYHDNGHPERDEPDTNPEEMNVNTENDAAYMDDVPGYKFVKWCSTPSGGGKCYDAGDLVKARGTVPEQDIHLYAIWEENTATLTYDATNCGGSTWDVTMYYSSKTTADDIRSDEVDGCYTFDGQWCDDRSCYDPGDIVKYADEEPENMTLYAQCTQKEYTITYNPNGGKWSDLTTTNRIYNNLPCGGNITLEGKPSKDYNNFKGWKSSLSSENSLYPYSSSYTIKDNVTMTAQWEEISYSCGVTHYECGGGVEATNKDTPYNSTKWTWNCGYLDCHECRGGYEEDDNGNCIKNQDGECDYSKTGPACKNGVEPQISADFSDSYGGGTVWICPAMGNGNTAICGASWRCEGGGTCKVRQNVDFCGYVGRVGSSYFNINNKSNCVNAGAYGTINPMSVQGRCYIDSNVFGYNLPNCNNVAGQGYSYSSCFEWEVDASSYTLTCTIMDDNGNLNVLSDESKCMPVLSKKPKCDGSELNVDGECGQRINTCVAGDFMDIEDGIDEMKWVCKGIGGGRSESCTKYIPEQSSDGYYQLTWNYMNGCGVCPWWECDSSQEGRRYTRFKTIGACEDARTWYGGELHPSGNGSAWCSSCIYRGGSSGGGSSSYAMIKNPAVELRCSYSSSLPDLPKIYSNQSACINDNVWKYGAVVNGVYKSNVTSQSQCSAGTCIPCATCSG